MVNQLKPMPRPGPGEKAPRYIPDTQDSLDKTCALCHVKDIIEDTRRKIVAIRRQKGLEV